MHLFSAKKIALFVIIFILLSMTEGKSEDMTCFWNQASITVDGQFEDWQDMPTTFFKDEGVSVGLANDSANLYILFRFTDRQWAQVIRMGGLNIWVDAKGKKKKDFGLKYNGGPNPAEMRDTSKTSRMNNQSDNRMQGMRNMEPPEAQFIVIDKNREVEKIIPTDGSEGPVVKFAMVKDFYSYEFKIPLKKSELNYYGAGAEFGKNVSVGLIWGEMERSKDQSRGGGQDFDGGGMPGGGGGMPGGGGGMPPGGGGGPGGRPGGGPGGGRQMPEKQEIWLKASLGTPPVSTSDVQE